MLSWCLHIWLITTTNNSDTLTGSFARCKFVTYFLISENSAVAGWAMTVNGRLDQVDKI